jgi:hypothetical protein
MEEGIFHVELLNGPFTEDKQWRAPCEQWLVL